MDNSKYEAVLKAVQAAFPELMELSFGCKVRSGSGVYTLIYKGEGADEKLYTSKDNELLPYGDTMIRDEILGHPIRLSHVLRAIGGQYAVDGDGRFLKEYGISAWDSNGSCYDLTKDDLSLQSPETIDFLFNILCE